jgi:hypothetical protein
MRVELAIALGLCLLLAGCGGAAGVVAKTGDTFDRFGCLSRDFKKDAEPCKPDAAE